MNLLTIAKRDEGKMLTATFNNDAVVREVRVPAVINSNEFGDLLGLEVLDIRAGGVEHLPTLGNSGEAPFATYDASVDAFYLVVARGNATRQSYVDVLLALDVNGTLCRIEFSLENRAEPGIGTTFPHSASQRAGLIEGNRRRLRAASEASRVPIP